MDIIGSLVLLVLFLPLLILIAITIKVLSPGPAFHKQERLGYMGKPFTFWKFRTMKVDSDKTPHKEHLERLINEDRPMTKLDLIDDPRIFPFGKFLRQTCLDELPQLLNVILGHMSLVGPRPCLPYEAWQYHRWQRRRFDVNPGMTGLWQVSGKNTTTFKEMIRLDIQYVRACSFFTDTKILLMTVPFILGQIRASLENSKGSGNP